MKKFYLQTYGCKLNQADSEIIRGLLSKKYKESSKKDADFVILNSCGVVEKTERKILKEASKLRRVGKRVIISGCLPLISQEACIQAADAVIGPSNISSLDNLIDGVFKNKQACITNKTFLDKTELYSDKKRKVDKSCSVIIAISEGCVGNCSYCATRLARKELKSFNGENILNEAEQALRQGFKELQITSQDLAVYGLDESKQKLPQLIDNLSKLKGNFRIKLGMMNPGHTKKMLKQLLKAYESEKVYKFIHIPLQSGDDELLKKMNRRYSVKDFRDIIKAFRKKFKDSIVATDIIVGHPMETEKAFNKTLKVIKATKPDIIHIFKFSKRKGTPDYLLKDYPDRIKKDRSRVLTELFQEMNINKNKKLLNKKFNVLIVEKRNNKYLARTDSGRAVVLDQGKIGSWAKVKIINYRWNYLIGKIDNS